MKKLSVLLAALMMTALLAACGGGTSSTPPADTGGSASTPSEATGNAANTGDIYVAVLTKGFVGDFWKAVELGAVAAGEELGIRVTIEGPDTETDFEQQITQIENAIQKGADVIAISALDTKAMVPYVEEAVSKGITVVTFNSVLESDVVTSHIATDNWAAGEMAGEKLAEAIGYEGKVAIIGSVEGVKNNRDRSDGAAEVLAQYEGIEVVGIQYCDNDLNKAISIATDFMTANPDLVGFFSNNETSSIGVATALKEKSMDGEIRHIGFDSSDQIIAQVVEGTTNGFITQDPYRMGYLAVEIGMQAHLGQDVPALVDTGCVFVDTSNMEDADIEKILYPLGK